MITNEEIEGLFEKLKGVPSAVVIDANGSLHMLLSGNLQDKLGLTRALSLRADKAAIEELVK